MRFELQDLVGDALVLSFCRIPRRRCVLYVHIGVVSSYFSLLRVRSRASSTTAKKLVGDCLFSDEAEGNKMLRNCLQLLCVCDEVGTFGCIENPSASHIWKTPQIQELASRPGKEIRVVGLCSFGLIDPVSAVILYKAHHFLRQTSDFAQAITEMLRWSRPPTR